MTDDGLRDGTKRGIGLRNRQAMLREILLSGPLSRGEIAERIGLTQTSVSRIARNLLDEGLLRALPARRGSAGGQLKQGRGGVPLDIDPQGGYVLGIGIGPTFQTITVADLLNDVVGGTHLELETIGDPEDVVRRVAGESRRLMGTLPESRARFLGALVMASASVDPDSGGVVAAPYLGWGEYPLQARLAEALGVTVKVRSMAATIARVESLFGAARGRGSVLTLLCGLGIGAALILDGRLIEGNRFLAGGIGWMETTAEDGTPATLDSLASGLGILRRLHGEDMEPQGTPVPAMARALLEAIEREGGDPAVRTLMSSAGRALGRAAVRLTPLTPPELVLIAGPLSMSRSYVAAARDAVAEEGAPRTAEILSSGVTGPVSGQSASCAMAIYEFLVERHADLGVQSGRGGADRA